MGYQEILLEENPRGWYGASKAHSRAAKKGWGRRNPVSNPRVKAGALAMPTSIDQFFAGVSPMDAAWAVGGFAGAIMLPGAIIRVADTTGQRVGKFLLALGSAGVVGLAAKSVGGVSAARAAVAGGMAGALSQALSSLGVVIGSPIRQLPAGRSIAGTARATQATAPGTEEVVFSVT